MVENFQISWMNRQDSTTPWIESHIKSKKQETKACLLYYHCICTIVLWKKYFNISWNSTVASCFLFTFFCWLFYFIFWELEFFFFFVKLIRSNDNMTMLSKKSIKQWRFELRPVKISNALQKRGMQPCRYDTTIFRAFTLHNYPDPICFHYQIPYK